MNMLKPLWYQMLDKLRIPDYYKIQSYEVLFEVELENTENIEFSGKLGVPMPLESDYQKLLTEPCFNSEVAVEKCKSYGNAYALVDFNLKPGDKKTISECFKVKVKPRDAVWGKWLLTGDSLPEEFYQSKHLHPNDPRIIEAARSCVLKAKSIKDILIALNNYVIHYLVYGKPIKGLYTDLEALESKVVDCGGFDIFLASLAAALKIEARIVSGFWADMSKDNMHAWVEFKMPDGTWVSADPSVEQLRMKGRTKKSGRMGFVGSDRIAFSLGSDILIETKTEKIIVDILQHPFFLPQDLGKKIKVNTKVSSIRL